jgi:coproporphyrinogen III oxidase-like Fe-S oxidoreductase
MLGLRTAQGLDLRDLETAFPKSTPNSTSLSTLQATIDSLIHRNLLQLHDNRLSLTEPGLSLADEVIRSLMILPD